MTYGTEARPEGYIEQLVVISRVLLKPQRAPRSAMTSRQDVQVSAGS